MYIKYKKRLLSQISIKQHVHKVVSIYKKKKAELVAVNALKYSPVIQKEKRKRKNIHDNDSVDV